MESPVLTPRLTFFLAVTAGVTVANICYNQALLPKIGETFHADSAATAWISIATQLGYANGLLLLVPLGDSVNRKTLLVSSAIAASIAMLLVAFSVNLGMAIAASYLVGFVGITPQLAIPYGAGLAPAEKRGQAVGTIMSGLLVGILGARSFAGLLGTYLGWRDVLAVGSGITLLVGLCLARLPSVPVLNPQSYRSILGSLWPLLKREPVLLRHSILGALSFGGFGAFWTTLAFYLASRPEHYGSDVVGYFGLVAIAGVAAAPIAGRLSDRHGPKVVNGIALGTMFLSFCLMALSDHSLAWLVVGTFLMDAGAQANQISNQTRIYALAGEMRNRLTSVYMVIYFLGGTAGSIAGSYAWRHAGWVGSCAVGATLAAIGFIFLQLQPGRKKEAGTTEILASDSTAP